jgi:hypothetical protein
MVLYSDLKNWENGNILDIGIHGLISLVRYFEGGKTDSDIVYDIPTDAEYTGVPDDTPTATDEQTEDYLASQQEDRANEVNERAIQIGEHGGALDE